MTTFARDIPVRFTPPGGYGETMPGPILEGCDEPLVDGAPDLRGFWQVTTISVEGAPVPNHSMVGSVQRIEQGGDRLIVTSGGIVHDMRVDGTLENGVHDVMAADFTTEIQVIATYEDGVHILRPEGTGIEVMRRRDGADMIWTYGHFFEARLKQIGPPNADPSTLVTQ